jgi:signal transduction histidine kinase
MNTGVTDAQCEADRERECHVTLPLQPHDTIYIDRFKVNQIIRNLISNALKFTPTGGDVIMQAVFMQDIKKEDEGHDLEIAPSGRSPASYFVDYVR